MTDLYKLSIKVWYVPIITEIGLGRIVEGIPDKDTNMENPR